eukprot:SAG22_NODE_10750_length_518_cov_0.400955_2_plen_90_part_01
MPAAVGECAVLHAALLWLAVAARVAGTKDEGRHPLLTTSAVVASPHRWYFLGGLPLSLHRASAAGAGGILASAFGLLMARLFNYLEASES